jgi:hypothetical protein
MLYVILLVLLAVGCRSEKNPEQMAVQPKKRALPESGGLYDPRSVGSHAGDFVNEWGPSFFDRGNAWYHAAQLFYEQTRRWPTNIIELSSVAKPSDPLFDRSLYNNAGFMTKADGDLEIRYQNGESGPGQINEVVNVEPPLESKKTK